MLRSPRDARRHHQVAPDGDVAVWDPMVRVLHWVLVAAFAVTFLSGDDWATVHEVAGYTVAAMVGVRVLWGVIGTHHARFASFVSAPGTVAAFLRDTVFLRARRYLGHNPAGGAMVVALMLALTLVSVTGIALSVDLFGGPGWLETLHELAANTTLVLVALHVVGVIVASFEHGENLVRAMFTGRKRGASGNDVVT